MGMFDFLKSKDVPVSGQMGPNGLMQPPTMEHQPGLWERYKTPNDQGVSMADRVLMAAMSFNGDQRGAMQYGSDLKKTTRDKTDRERKNAAIKAAYKDGKFDMPTYMAVLGDQGDATEALGLAKELSPKTGVDGSFSYSIDPISGQVTWGDQRGMSHSEEAQLSRQDEIDRHQREMERLALLASGQKGQLVEIARQRAAHAGAAKPGSSGVPTGYHIVTGAR